MAKKNLDSLIQYGTSFQIKSIATLLKNPTFLDQISDILHPDFYDSDSMKWIIKTILEYFGEFHASPTMEVFKLELDKKIDNKLMKESIIEKLRAIYQNFNTPDLKYIEENFLKFVKNQEMKNAILKSADLVQNGNYDGIRDLVTKALHAGESRDVGVIWKEQDFFNRRITDTLRSPIATPWPVINDITDGGLGAGELGIVVAPGGIGKCVGKNTEIEIEYEEYGIDFMDYEIWFKPWDKILVYDKYMFMYEFANIISECVAND